MTEPQDTNNQQRERSVDEIKTLIKGKLTSTSMSVLITNTGITFKTPYGDVNIPNDSINYYYTLFKDNIQKSDRYEQYRTEIDGWFQEQNPSKLCTDVKEIARWFNISELFVETYSVISQWLLDNTITKEMLAQLYKAYTYEDATVLDQQLVSKFTLSLKRTLSYYNVMLKIFEIFDTELFDR